MQPPKLVTLAQLVKTTADELRNIHADEPKGDTAVMRFVECEVELDVAVGADADGKVKFWVVEAGAGVSYENSQKVKLKFTALPNVLIQAPAMLEGLAPLPNP
jgi:Trypsin-co-occurring domain 2